jgi:hypothetical protein
LVFLPLEGLAKAQLRWAFAFLKIEDGSDPPGKLKIHELKLPSSVLA